MIAPSIDGCMLVVTFQNRDILVVLVLRTKSEVALLKYTSSIFAMPRVYA